MRDLMRIIAVPMMFWVGPPHGGAVVWVSAGTEASTSVDCPGVSAFPGAAIATFE